MATARSTALLGATVDRLFESPALTIAGAARDMKVTYRAAKKNVEKLVKLGVLSAPGKSGRNRVYLAPEILALTEA